MNSPDRRKIRKKTSSRKKKSKKLKRHFSYKNILKSLAAYLHQKKYAVPLILSLSLLWFYACPEKTVIPVQGAAPVDLNPDSFWDCSWCTQYNKHMGIDIIKEEGTPILAAVNGMILYSGWLGKYGRAVVMITPKLQVHLYGHMSRFIDSPWPFVRRGVVIGFVGNTGTSDCPHLHYTIFSILPHVWLFEPRNMGWLKMFFLNPRVVLSRP